ncbi:MAG: hypothetical protein QMD88_06895 [Coprothermobacterota bacterium]|nr:hypothetical protein [Coprothermobacterota bacterium]
MKRSEDNGVRQASRIVSAAQRQAMAKEMARITGNKANQPSALEQAAVEWEKEQEGEARKTSEGKLRISRQVEVCPFSFEQVQLSAKSTELAEDTGWKPYGRQQEKKEEKRTTTIVTRRVNMASVCALSRRLMAIERARALGRKPVDFWAYTLEQVGQRWVEERARRK